jgi:type III restriction enzyme
MALHHINAISNRLSLRPPQRESLEILARVCEITSLAKDATDHANENGGKPWRYLLIPHDQIQDQMTLAGLAARCEV